MSTEAFDLSVIDVLAERPDLSLATVLQNESFLARVGREKLEDLVEVALNAGALPTAKPTTLSIEAEEGTVIDVTGKAPIIVNKRRDLSASTALDNPYILPILQETRKIAGIIDGSYPLPASSSEGYGASPEEAQEAARTLLGSAVENVMRRRAGGQGQASGISSILASGSRSGTDYIQQSGGTRSIG